LLEEVAKKRSSHAIRREMADIARFAASRKSKKKIDSGKARKGGRSSWALHIRQRGRESSKGEKERGTEKASQTKTMKPCCTGKERPPPQEKRPDRRCSN